MQNRKYTIIASLIAFVFWFLDGSIHYFVYHEPEFEVIPSEFNELWMRIVIVILIVFIGIHADFSIKQLLIKEKQLEAARIYNSMIFASQHILNNLLNQMQLFRLEALKSKDFDKDMIKLYDNTIDEASDLIQRLSRVAHITDENILASVHPGNIANKSKKTTQTSIKQKASNNQL